MGTKNNPGAFDCYEHAEDDEPMFVLLARDEIAPYLVRRWAQLHKSQRLHLRRGEYDTKELEALDCAAAMEAWRKEHRDD